MYVAVQEYFLAYCRCRETVKVPTVISQPDWDPQHCAEVHCCYCQGTARREPATICRAGVSAGRIPKWGAPKFVCLDVKSRLMF
jgi:hypothetical protein